MALGRRKKSQQQELFVTTDSLPTSDGHVFYSKLKQLLADEGFDQWIEELCASVYGSSAKPVGGFLIRIVLEASLLTPPTKADAAIHLRQQLVAS